MAYYNDGKVFRNLPEQVEKNKSDIESIQDAQKTDESNINTNLNNINAHETRINALESLKMTQDGQNIKLTKSTGEIGNIAVGTVGGMNILGGNDVTFKTINGESITGEGNLIVDTDLSSLLWTNLGVGRWSNQTFTNWSWKNPDRVIYDDLMPYYTNYTRMFENWDYSGSNNDIYFDKDTNPNIPLNHWFIKSKATGTIYLPNHTDNISINWTYRYANMFDSSSFSKILIQSGKTFELTSEIYYCFAKCQNLTEIGEFDVSKVTQFTDWLAGSNKIKSIHCKHFRNSFKISASTEFEESDLIEIISNLDAVSNGAVLTMGTTNLNKLTTDEISVATGKGWTLA